MKHFRIISSVSLAVLLSLPSFVPMQAQDDEKEEEQVIYRLYNSDSGEHLYTSSKNERNALYRTDWTYEGIAWISPTLSDKPVYRLFNPESGAHLYTMDKHEYDTLPAHGWRQENIYFYSDENSTYPIYRLYNTRSGAHHYTSDLNEYNVLAKGDWNQEGIAWYGSRASTDTEKQADDLSTGQVDYSSVADVPFIDQYANGAPVGCEGAAALQALKGLGYAQNISLRQFLAAMPKTNDGNPHHGFVGSPFIANSRLYTSIDPDALAPFVNKYGPARDISGATTNDLLEELRNGHVVVVYGTIRWAKPVVFYRSWGIGLSNNHAMTLYGYKGSRLHIMDPIYGDTWVARSAFERAYNVRHYAVSIG